jgi:hypothetical protein
MSDFRVLKTVQSNSEWQTLPVAEWDSAVISVSNDSSTVAIASWRWDVGSAYELSPNLAKTLIRAAELKYDYLLADIISLDQSSADIMTSVAVFSEFYYHLPSVTSYGNDVQDDTRKRTWIANELIRMVLSRTVISEIVPNIFEHDPNLYREEYGVARALLEHIAPGSSAENSNFAILIGDYMLKPGRAKLCTDDVMQLRFSDLFPPRARNILFGMMSSPFTSISVSNQRFTSDILVVFALWAELPKNLVGRLQQLRSCNKFIRMVVVLVLATKFQFFDSGCFVGFDIHPSDWYAFAQIFFGTPNEPPFITDQSSRQLDECAIWELPNEDVGKSDIGLDEPGTDYTYTEVDGTSYTSKQKFAERNYNTLKQCNLLNQPGLKIECTKYATEKERVTDITSRQMMDRSRAGGRRGMERDEQVTCKYAVFCSDSGDVYATSVVKQGRTEVAVKQYCQALLEKLTQVWPMVEAEDWTGALFEMAPCSWPNCELAKCGWCSLRNCGLETGFFVGGETSNSGERIAVAQAAAQNEETRGRVGCCIN